MSHIFQFEYVDIHQSILWTDQSKMFWLADLIYVAHKRRLFKETNM